jgi:hypothetical protein
MVLTAYIVLSPVIGLVCHRRLRIESFTRPVGPAKPPQTWRRRRDARTTRLRRPLKAPLVLPAAHRSRGSSRPATAIARATHSRPPHPVPTSVTIAKRPSVGRDGASRKTDLPDGVSEIFFQRGLDRSESAKSTDLPVGQFKPVE